MTTRPCLDCASDSSRQLFRVQLAYSADAIWFEAVWAFWERKRERERAVIHSRCLWNYVSHKVFKLLYKLFNEDIWIVPHLEHFNYFTRAGQRLRRCAACRAKSLTAGASSARDLFLRSAFLETADQTPPSNYRPIMIGIRSIGAPLIYIDEVNFFCLSVCLCKCSQCFILQAFTMHFNIGSPTLISCARRLSTQK